MNGIYRRGTQAREEGGEGMALKLQKHGHMQDMDQIHEARSRGLAESWKACCRLGLMSHKPKNCSPKEGKHEKGVCQPNA